MCVCVCIARCIFGGRRRSAGRMSDPFRLGLGVLPLAHGLLGFAWCLTFEGLACLIALLAFGIVVGCRLLAYRFGSGRSCFRLAILGAMTRDRFYLPFPRLRFRVFVFQSLRCQGSFKVQIALPTRATDFCSHAGSGSAFIARDVVYLSVSDAYGDVALLRTGWFDARCTQARVALISFP